MHFTVYQECDEETLTGRINSINLSQRQKKLMKELLVAGYNEGRRIEELSREVDLLATEPRKAYERGVVERINEVESPAEVRDLALDLAALSYKHGSNQQRRNPEFLNNLRDLLN